MKTDSNILKNKLFEINKTSKKTKTVFSNHKNKMHIYCKKCKKHTGNTFPKKLVLISKNKMNFD